MTSIWIFLFVVVPFLLVETLRSTLNERRLRAEGAVAPPGDPYAGIAVTYTGGFIAMALEGYWRGGPVRPWLLVGLLVFALGKLVKFWAIASLGRFWSFKILVVPGAPLVTSGPYRYMTHPNYVGIYGEFIGTALMVNAPIAGVATCLSFLYFLRQRIVVEERALGIGDDSPRAAGRIQ